MKVIFDIMHPAHINFFSQLVKRLKKDNVQVGFRLLDRGKVVKIFQKEYPDYSYKTIGTHSNTQVGLYLKTGVWRTIILLFSLLNEKCDFVLGVAAFQAGFASKLMRGTRSLLVYDDPEYKLNFLLSKQFADRLYMPAFCHVESGNVYSFECLKEWAYLSPKYFNPNPGVLEKYGIKPYEYIFIREVDTKSLNYREQERSIIEDLNQEGIKKPVLLSLENKERESIYSDWTVLNEPVDDIHSLMYFSRALISNGDSMAREGAMLGVKSVYCGIRDMKANNYLYERNLLSWIINTHELVDFIAKASQELKSDDIEHQKNKVRDNLLVEWDDVNEVLYDAIMNWEEL